MMKAARTAARIASGSKKGSVANLTEKPFKTNYYPVTTRWEEVLLKDKMPYLQKLNDKIFSLDKRVSKVSASLTDSTSHILFCNSEGVAYYDYRPMTTLGAVCIMEENGKIENSYAARAYRKGFEFLNDDVIATIAREAVDNTSILFKAVKPKGGEMPVVMGAGGSVNIDDEGTYGEKTYIVKNGVLNSYLHDRISAKHYGIASTGNGRRESFKQVPIPRMRVTYMESGNMTEQDIFHR